MSAGEEDWVESPGWWGRGTHFRLVAAHELGHALGLPHIRSAVVIEIPNIILHFIAPLHYFYQSNDILIKVLY